MTAERIVLWRHARTGHNHRGVWQGQLDVDLDDEGRAQAVVAATSLCSALAGFAPVCLVSSDLRRARATAAALEDVLGVEASVDARLREVDAGAWQGLTREEIVAAGIGEELAAWRRGEDVRVGGGERRSEVAARGAAAVLEHASRLGSGVLVIASHGGLLRGAMLTLLGLPDAAWGAFGGLSNGCWAVLAPPAGPFTERWRLLSYNVSEGGM